ncbi:MAG: family 1 encapsulin nanocompartment shell protein [Microthrixaceae bacterium]|nr:family 1 encapsulin nanocompartment shell protein [Microthrixaceae bacterium]
MNHLHRDLAPITDAAWAEIDSEAKRALENFLAARRLVDFSGPHGWEAAAVTLGTVEPIEEPPADGVRAASRLVQTYVELCAPFTLARRELDAIDRGHKSPDLDAVVDAARSVARAEDRAVFHGYGPGNIAGIVEVSPHEPIEIHTDYALPDVDRHGGGLPCDAGVEGPYGIALGPDCYAGILESTEDGGYPILERLRLILQGPVVYAPAVSGAVVLSMRGDDFELYCGQDYSIGFSHADAETVELYIEESLTFHVHSAEAAVALKYA